MVGQQIGKYRVTQQLGRGGMGTVYGAIDETLHRDVAIKVLNAGLNDPTVARRFRAEAVTIARLNHPGIATIYELVQHDGQWLMVMEYVRGETLERVVAEQGPLPVDRAADLVMQMLAALAHAHGLGVVHRDLKPANLMLTANGSVKIMDFGIARVAGGEQLTTAGFMMGTPAYMAPEQVLGQDIDARTDLYAAGLVLYHLVTGTLPFKGETPVQMAQARVHDTPTPIRAARASVPDWLGQVLDIALSRDPKGRFQTALLFREAIRCGLMGLPIEVPDASGLPPELVATVAPGSLPVVETPPQKAAPPLAAPMPTVAAAPIAQLPELPRTRTTAQAATSRTAVWTAVAAVVVIVGGLATWTALRSPAPEPVAVAETADVSAAEPDTSSPPAEPNAPPSPETTTVSPLQGSAAAATPAPNGAAMAAASATSESEATSAPTSPGASTAAAAEAATGDRAAASGPGRATSDAASAAPPTFRGVRGFLVTGRRVDERPAILTFANGQVTLTDENGRTSYASLPYSQVTSAVYTRGRNPRWYPTLAGPPADVDMPGGLFRGDRYWLALQSRNGYLIVRMNDDDWRRIVATVTEQIGLDVTQLSQ